MKTILLVPSSPNINFTALSQNFASKIGAKLITPFVDEAEIELRKAIAANCLDELLEKTVALQDSELIVCQGIAADANVPYANYVNHSLANALDADVIFVSENNENALLYARTFGGPRSARILGMISSSTADAADFTNIAHTNNAGDLVDTNDTAINTYLNTPRTKKLSPSAFRTQVVAKAQAAKKRIVLPEGDEPRTIEAAAICQSRGIAQCVLLGDPAKINEVAKSRGVTLPADIEIIDPASIADKYVAPMVERRKGKVDDAGAKQALSDTVVLGTMMLHVGDVDGLVSGAVHTTADTIRPAFQLIKTAPEYSLVSSVFFMLMPEQVVVCGDCAVNPNPTPEQLAEIAIQSAQSAKAFGIEPKVAMISYSTGTSGAGPDVDAVVEATKIVRERAPDLAVDGPLQFDAASVPSVGKSKAPNSPVAGQANVFIFPDLNTGNTTYKAIQRSAGLVSVGPMLQGLNKPVNDLSRGALVDDIVYTIALTAIQAADDAI